MSIGKRECIDRFWDGRSNECDLLRLAPPGPNETQLVKIFSMLPREKMQYRKNEKHERAGENTDIVARQRLTTIESESHLLNAPAVVTVLRLIVLNSSVMIDFTQKFTPRGEGSRCRRRCSRSTCPACLFSSKRTLSSLRFLWARKKKVVVRMSGYDTTKTQTTHFFQGFTWTAKISTGRDGGKIDG